MVVIEDGTGTGNRLRITPSNRVKTVAIEQTLEINATSLGNSFYLNSGIISGLTSGDAGVVYIKNLDDKTLFLDSMAFGVGPQATAPPNGGPNITITLIKNPTTGTVISDANTDGVIKANRNFGSTITFDGTVYGASADGKTFTDGTSIAQFYTTGASRLFANINMSLPKNKSIGVIVNPVGSTITAYCSFYCNYINQDDV